jgi:2-polyprenyl-3-methyl-5-hydroxy-6-metoxy-1,4-benzoquinol methylase
MIKHTKESIKKKVKELSQGQDWNHLFVLPGDVRTKREKVNSPGFSLNKAKRLKEIYETTVCLEGKTVLDVACSDGLFSIQCAKAHNARSVKGIDLDELRIERAKFVKEVLKIPNVEFNVQDLYSLSDDTDYDIVLALGLLHRTPDLETCIKKVCKIGSTVVLEFKTLPGETSEKKDFGGKTKSNGLNGLYCIPTKNYVLDELKKYNFKYTKIFDDDSHLNFKRTIIVASLEPIG